MRACALRRPWLQARSRACQTQVNILQNSASHCMQNSCKDLCPLPIVPSPVAPRIPPGDLIFTVRVPSGRQLSGISRFWADFLLIKKRIEKQHPSETPKNRKNLIWERFGLRFWSLFGSLLAPISQYFKIPRKPLFCNRSTAKRSFSPPKPSHFGTKFQSNFDVFSVLVLGHPFFVIFPT